MEMGVLDVMKLLMRLEAYIFVLLAVGSFLVVFGSYRRRSNSAFFRFVMMVVFNSSFTLITLIIGQMVSRVSSHGERGSFFALWAAYLISFHGISDKISAYSLEDNEQWHSSIFTLYVALLYFFVVIIWQDTVNSFFIGLAAISGYFATTERIGALKLGSKNGVAVDSKPVADFMATDLLAADQLAYHNYLILKGYESVCDSSEEKVMAVDVSSEEVMTFGRVLNCEGRLLSNADSKKKDLCLSFSMYNLLCCHFAGYSFPRATRDRQLEFVRDVLLKGDVGNGGTFRLIEQELGFLHDRFYTKYAYLFELEGFSWRYVSFLFSAVISLAYLLPNEIGIKLLLKTDEVVQNDITITRIVIGVIMCLEFLQMLFFAVSNWGKLASVCVYVERPSWRSNMLTEKFVQCLCSFPCFKLWGRELGQYCFLESFNKNPPWLIYNVLSQTFLPSPGKGRHGNTFVPLCLEVQRAVLSWIKQNGWRLTKGRSSLIDNGVRNHELLSACEFEETTKVIMIWHIATRLCEFQHRKKSPSLEKFVVSVALSKYCAYLVAFAPRLLPDHYVQTNYLFDSAVRGTEWMLEGCQSMEDKYRKIMNFAEIAQSMQTDFVTGIGGRVAKLLMEEAGDDEEMLWKILADFWTEMVLFVAPCDDPWPHAEHLARGGEFVTHLMALLFHAGVTKRDSIEDDVMV